MIKSIDMDQLKYLYYHQKKSAFEVAEIFGCSPAVIYGRMKKHGMQCRSYSESQKIRYAQVGLNLDITELNSRRRQLWPHPIFRWFRERWQTLKNQQTRL